MKNKLIILFCICVGLTSVHAQDVHFSQMGYSPLNLNPALAGANNGLQALVNYRSQWNSVATPFSTFGFSVDSRLTGGKKGFLAMGLNFFNDQAGQARMSTTNMNLNIAYHVYLNEEHKLGGGMYVGFGQRSLKDVGTWSAQYDGSGFNPGFSNQENIDNMQFAHFDLGGGLLYSYEEDGRSRSPLRNRINAGVALFHLNRPNYSFISTSDEKLYMRWSVFASALLKFGDDSNFGVEPAVYYNRQGTTQEILFGTYARYVISSGSRYNSDGDVIASLGAFYRNKDAFIAKAMFTWSGLSVGFAYDINTSNLSAMSKSRGGFELFLQWVMDSPFGNNKASSRWR